MKTSWKPLLPHVPIGDQISPNDQSLFITGRLRGGSGMHIPQTTGTGLTAPWEGLLISEQNGSVIHLAKHSSKEVLLDAIAELNMTPDNLIIVYASAYFNTCGLTRETWNEEAEQLLQQISSFAPDWRIKRMDMTPRGDIIVAVEETYIANAVIEAQYITINSLKGAVYLPTGPVVEYGVVNI